MEKQRVDDKLEIKDTFVIKEKVVPEKKAQPTSTPTPSKKPNLIQLSFNIDDIIELLNLESGNKHAMIIKTPKVRLTNFNIYRIPVSNKELNSDNFHAIKIYNRYSEYFRILAVKEGCVSILPLINNFEISNSTTIGELI